MSLKDSYTNWNVSCRRIFQEFVEVAVLCFVSRWRILLLSRCQRQGKRWENPHEDGVSTNKSW